MFWRKNRKIVAEDFVITSEGEQGFGRIYDDERSRGRNMKTKLKVWVNRMPSTCERCPFSDLQIDFPHLYCNVSGDSIGDVEIESERHSNCPLRLLSEVVNVATLDGEI